MSSIRARRPTWGKENRSENHNRINLGSSSIHAGRSYEPLSDPERTRRCDQYASDLDEFIQDSNEPPHASPFRIKFDNTLYEDEDEYEEEYDSTAIKIEEAEESDILTRLRSFSRPYGSPHELDPQAKRVYPSLSKDTFIQRLSSPKALHYPSVRSLDLSILLWCGNYGAFPCNPSRDAVLVELFSTELAAFIVSQVYQALACLVLSKLMELAESLEHSILRVEK
ncbi:hypothetical protein PIIN_10980 [Serendipita indica DSM 11827]|uniref:Uncharacterized protein n=1 Tax=Serendipita indica (strain DSM 11827) TaxID=1109443 RepID=G4U0A2_SERID|nr:hypothetical protein PIIN_10980 [Serendipita indica DSM 11827]